MIQVVPIDDLKNHEDNSSCDCCPQVVFEEDDFLVIHNSYDGRELIEKGINKGVPMNIKSREGIDLSEGDVVESVQGTKFYCISIGGISPRLIDTEGKMYTLESFMSPNLFHLGNIWTNMGLRNIFFPY